METRQNIPSMDNFKPKNVKKTPKSKRCVKRTEDASSKYEVKRGWNMTKIVLIVFWKKSKKDIVKLNVLQCLNTITMKTLPWETWKNEIYSQLFFIYLGTQFGYTGVKNPLVYATGWLVLVFCFYFTRDIPSKTDFFVFKKKKKYVDGVFCWNEISGDICCFFRLMESILFLHHLLRSLATKYEESIHPLPPSFLN